MSAFELFFFSTTAKTWLIHWKYPFWVFLLGRTTEVKRLSSLLKAFRNLKMDVFKHIDTKYVKVKKGMFYLSRLSWTLNSSYKVLISQEVWYPISLKDLGQNYSFENSSPYCSFTGGEMGSREKWCDWNKVKGGSGGKVWTSLLYLFSTIRETI